MIDILLYGLAAIGAVAITVFALFIVGLCWMAKGEPDVNGDPERDAGLQ